jgi:hypothetical protein
MFPEITLPSAPVAPPTVGPTRVPEAATVQTDDVPKDGDSVGIRAVPVDAMGSVPRQHIARADLSITIGHLNPRRRVPQTDAALDVCSHEAVLNSDSFACDRDPVARRPVKVQSKQGDRVCRDRDESVTHKASRGDDTDGEDAVEAIASGRGGPLNRTTARACETINDRRALRDLQGRSDFDLKRGAQAGSAEIEYDLISRA